MTRLEEVQLLDHKLLQEFLQSGQSSSIPETLQDYIRKINAVPAIVHYNGSAISRCIKALCRQFPDLTYSQARGIYEDAMNFFYMDNMITSDAWDNYYADQFDKLARLSLGMDKPEAAIRAFSKAHELRTRSTDRIKPGDWAPPTFIISDRIKPEQLGYAKQNLYDIARKAESGYYKKLIDGLPITDKEKERLFEEAEVEDAAFEELATD
ncbi:MAG: hypothetical protein IKB48_05760 [Bacteroidales bacterium]|nr:hypothetical protein [Bacteroidales bacterium]